MRKTYLICSSKKMQQVFWGLLIMLFFNHCHSHRVANLFQKIPNSSWDYDKPLKFDINITDTTVSYTTNINLRYNSAYLYPYLGLVVAITAPDGQVEKREVTFYLQDEKGKFKGDVAGDIWDYCCFTLIEPQRFQQGKYHFSVYQITAMPSIKDVMGLGLELEKTP
jgi:gliding motility-associated lipoprotein GldH